MTSDRSDRTIPSFELDCILPEPPFWEACSGWRAVQLQAEGIGLRLHQRLVAKDDLAHRRGGV